MAIMIRWMQMNMMVHSEGGTDSSEHIKPHNTAAHLISFQCNKYLKLRLRHRAIKTMKDR